MGCASSSPQQQLAGQAPAMGSSDSSAGAGSQGLDPKPPLRDSVMETQNAYGVKASGAYSDDRQRTSAPLQVVTDEGPSLQTGELIIGGVDHGACSLEAERKSRGSACSAVRVSTRSSFAADAAALQAVPRKDQHDALGPMAGRNKATVERLSGMPEGTGLSGQFVPAALQKPFSMLVVVPPDTPVPASMLQNLWQLQSLSQTLAVVSALQTQGALRVATLDDGSTWCLVSSITLDHLQSKYGPQAPAIHAALLDAYARSAVGGKTMPGGALQVRDIPDDGYIMQNIAHHLIGCGRLGALRSLLGEPAWLEAKLHSYGTAPVVADFRRYLAEEPDDQGARLLLQAFQLSLGCCAEQPGTSMLREQMLARLIDAANQKPGSVLRSPSAGGALSTRRTDSARAANDDHSSGLVEGTTEGLKSLSVSGTPAGTSMATSPAPRDSARYSDATGSLREWFEAQSSHATMDIITSAGRTCVHLLPRSASLKQAGGLQRMILRGHAGPIHKVVISPNGQDVVTVSQDGSAQVWDMNVGDCVMQLARQQPLSAVDVAPDGCLCVVASVDGAACVWDLATGNVRHVLKGHTSKINSVAIDKRGHRCVTASDDRSVRVWDIASGTCQAVLGVHSAPSQKKTKRSGLSEEFGLVFDVALSSDGSMAATASEDFSAQVWDLDEGKCEHILSGHSGWVVAVRFIGDTTHVITASHDHTARIWDGIRGCCLHVLTGHTGRLNNVRCDPDGRIAVTCSDDGSARIWDIETGKCTSVLQRHDAWVADAAIARDGSRVVTVGGDGLVCVWDCVTGELKAALEGHSGAVSSVVLTGGGRFAVTAGEDATAIVWDLGVKGMRAHPQQQGHVSKVLAAAALPGRQQVVTSSEEGEVLLWSVAECKTVQSLQGMVASAAYLGAAAESDKVLAGSANRQVCCWRAEDGQLVSSLPAQQGSRVKDLAFSRSGRYVGMVLFDSQTSVWDVETGKLVAQLIGRGERTGRNVHTGGVNGILLCGEEEQPRTAVTWSKDCTARVWDIPSNSVRCVCEGHTDGIKVAVISGDRMLLATGSYGNTVRLHLLSDGSPVAVLDHAASAVHVAFSPDSTLLAVALDNHTLVVWNLVERSCLTPVLAHKTDITCMVFSPDSLLLATGSQDCTLRVWDAHTGRAIAFFVADSAFTSCCFAGGEEGGPADILVAADAGGATHFLDLPLELQPGGGPL